MCGRLVNALDSGRVVRKAWIADRLLLKMPLIFGGLCSLRIAQHYAAAVNSNRLKLIPVEPDLHSEATKMSSRMECTISASPGL